MIIRAVLFDCDGVLVDSEPVAARVAAVALGELGWAVTPEECQATFTGMTLRDVLPIVEAQVGPVPQEWLRGLAARMLQAMLREAMPVPGAPEALQATTALGLPWRVASNSSRTEMEAKFRVTGLAPLVGDRFHSAADVGRGKPFPDLFLAAAEAAGAAPAQCVVVEDSVPGVRAAMAAGMRCLGLARHHDGAALAEAGARIVRDLAELPPILARAIAGEPI